VIRLDEDRLASGLNAMATQDDDVVTIVVSSELARGDRRAAVRVALRAARRAGWISPRVPLFLLPFARGFRQSRRSHRGVALLVAFAAFAACAGLVTYHLVTSGPAGASAAARKPAVPAHRGASRHSAATSAPAPGAGSPDVVISVTAVSEACWAELTVPGGATIFEGIVDRGTSMTWTERRAVTLRLANPGAVTLTVDGKTRQGLGKDPVTMSLAPGKRSSG
jgi:hypothetical protein